VRQAFGPVGKSILAGAPLDEILPENDSVEGRKTGQIKSSKPS
jgi:hypothetical protein